MPDPKNWGTPRKKKPVSEDSSFMRPKKRQVGDGLDGL